MHDIQPIPPSAPVKTEILALFRHGPHLNARYANFIITGIIRDGFVSFSHCRPATLSSDIEAPFEKSALQGLTLRLGLASKWMKTVGVPHKSLIVGRNTALLIHLGEIVVMRFDKSGHAPGPVYWEHGDIPHGTTFQLRASLIYLTSQPEPIGFMNAGEVFLFEHLVLCQGQLHINTGSFTAQVAFHSLGQGAREITLPDVPVADQCIGCLGFSPHIQTQLWSLALEKRQGNLRSLGLACKSLLSCYLSRNILLRRLFAHEDKLLLILHGCLILAQFPQPLSTLCPGTLDGPIPEVVLLQGLSLEAHFEPLATRGTVLLVDPDQRTGYSIDMNHPLSKFSIFPQVPLPRFENTAANWSFFSRDAFCFIAPKTSAIFSLSSMNSLAQITTGSDMAFLFAGKGTLKSVHLGGPTQTHQALGFGGLADPKRLMVLGRRFLSLHENYLVCHEYHLGLEDFRPASFSFALRLAAQAGNLSLEPAVPPADDRCRVVVDNQWAIVVDLALARVLSYQPANRPLDQPTSADLHSSGGPMTALSGHLAALDLNGVLLFGTTLDADRRLVISDSPEPMRHWSFRPNGVFTPHQPGLLAVAAGADVHFVCPPEDTAIRQVLNRVLQLPFGGRRCLAATQLDDDTLVLQFSDGFFDFLALHTSMRAAQHFLWRNNPSMAPAGPADRVWVCPWLPLCWVAYEQGARFVFHAARLRDPHSSDKGSVSEPWAFLPARTSFALSVATWPGVVPPGVQAAAPTAIGVAFLRHMSRRFCAILYAALNHGQRVALIPEEDIIRLFIDSASPEVLSRPLICISQDIEMPVSSDILTLGHELQSATAHPTVVLRSDAHWRTVLLAKTFPDTGDACLRSQIRVELWPPPESLTLN
ncbi:hypothetical protein H696_06165 [Fonticula alba]|uniref:Uncharacterized protein n=1 Tax=Fonticula alba TaxID=691883 RepID=A0A058YZJ9_FONAL|nr:hypothetical protein H696_06165 [Fonticula alba]KCV67410.1 hypothetical protein H696_06165 [Fonticula alba]|eukprot:XP_009498186.1 hypothetical protein H696_06165 [Fonticula alba]